VESDGKNSVKSVFAGLERLSPPDLLDMVAVNAVAAVFDDSGYLGLGKSGSQPLGRL
jgi:hypothetical protein